MTDLSDNLAQLSITVSSVHMCVDSHTDSKHPRDMWMCTISYEGRDATFDYWCGIGNRKVPSHIRRDKSQGGKNRYWDSFLHEYVSDNEAYMRSKPTSPDLADVLRCLMSDSSAMYETFDEWCGSCGADNDSIKALNTYIACQRSGEKLRRVLGGELLETLRFLDH